MDLRENAAWAMVVPTSMGVRLTPPDGQPVHCSRVFGLDATFVSADVASNPNTRLQ